MNAYGQNLAGRLAEAQRDVGLIIDRAKRADMPIHTYLEEFRKADNPVFVREGASLQAKINRAAFLEDDLGALERASVVLKPVVREESRRVGKECVSTYRSRVAPVHYKPNKITI